MSSNATDREKSAAGKETRSGYVYCHAARLPVNGTLVCSDDDVVDDVDDDVDRYVVCGDVYTHTCVAVAATACPELRKLAAVAAPAACAVATAQLREAAAGQSSRCFDERRVDGVDEPQGVADAELAVEQFFERVGGEPGEVLWSTLDDRPDEYRCVFTCKHTTRHSCQLLCSIFSLSQHTDRIKPRRHTTSRNPSLHSCCITSALRNNRTDLISRGEPPPLPPPPLSPLVRESREVTTPKYSEDHLLERGALVKQGSHPSKAAASEAVLISLGVVLPTVVLGVFGVYKWRRHRQWKVEVALERAWGRLHNDHRI